MAIVTECVGLDIGQTGLKAVRFRRRLSGRESIDYFQHPMPFARPEDLEPARRVQTLRGFLWQHGLYATDRLVTAIPCQDLFVRTLSFPFKDSTKLAQVVPFEVENLVPMPLEDLAIGSLVLPPGHTPEGTPRESKGSDVLVTAAPKDKVAEHLRFLAQADVEPSAINVDAMALFSVTQYLREENTAVPHDLAIIDVGASKTTLCLVHEGRPVVLRTILWGGNHLTQALAIREACSFAEAERRKRSMAIEQVDTWLEPLLKELRVTLQAYEGATRGRLTHCWVSGGGSKLREIGGFIARKLGLYPVGPRQGFGTNSPRAFSIAFGLAIHPKIIKPRWRFKPSPIGLALDLKGVTDGAALKSDLSPQDRRLAVIAALVIGLLATADFTTHLMLKDRRVAGLKATLHQHFERSFGAGASPGDEIDQARYRMGTLDKALAIVDGGQGNALPTLAAFVKQLPGGTPVKVRELTLDGGTILMEGETTSFDAVEKIKQTFMASAQFEEAAVTETRVGASSNQIVFRMTVTVRRP
ncbi:MAG: pilus assembly protein PilM [Nitrospira sp.]|nr:pilus assembly protein PilM [Nitrospira sp.]MBH0181870.1 pilus assembly protein PilM [Nitrospira sp.]MBH0186343.1 pilus assembly protein PilM [Nitrospira sp.]